MSVTNMSYSLAPSVSRREHTLGGRLMSAILSQWPQRTRGSPPTDSYMRRDIGLEPIEPSRKYWDHQ
jgi:hypothetical protein